MLARRRLTYWLPAMIFVRMAFFGFMGGLRELVPSFLVFSYWDGLIIFLVSYPFVFEDSWSSI